LLAVQIKFLGTVIYHIRSTEYFYSRICTS